MTEYTQAFVQVDRAKLSWHCSHVVEPALQLWQLAIAQRTVQLREAESKRAYGSVHWIQLPVSLQSAHPETETGQAMGLHELLLFSE